MRTKNESVIEMKQIPALILISVIVFSVLNSCSAPRSLPAEETAAAAPVDGKPYFELSELPKIGSYYDKTVYRRMTQGRVETFVPSDQYGAVLPYIGDCRSYTMMEYRNEDGSDSGGESLSYGLMTVDGTVITDVVYDYAYMESGMIVLGRSFKEGEEAFECQMVTPVSGQWFIEEKDKSSVLSHVDIFPQQERIIIIGRDTMSVYDFNGKKLFAKDNISPDEYIFLKKTKRFVTTAYMNDTPYTTMLDETGKELWSVKGVTYKGGFYGEGDSEEYFKVEDDQWKSGILNKDGSWYLEPIYNDACVYGDKYFIVTNWYEDGSETRVFGENMDPMFFDGDAPQFEWFGGELICSETDDSDNRHFTSLQGDPIGPAGKALLNCQTVDGTDLFFGVDSSGVGYIFTRDGTVKKTFPDAIEINTLWRSNAFEVITGSEQKKTAHVLDAKTAEEKHSYLCYDKASGVTVRWDGSPFKKDDSQLKLYEVTEENSEGNLPYCKIVDAETGKTVVDRLDAAQVFTVNGREYYNILKDNVSTVEDIDGNVLLRIPCPILD